MSSAFAQRIERLFGDPLLEPAGVAQVASVARDDRGRLALLRAGAGAPASETDRFVLEVSRARADVIVTTGKILREEPELRLDLGKASAHWRAAELGKTRPAQLLVLTSGRELPVRHPVFSGPGAVVIFTDDGGAETLKRRDFALRPEIVTHAAPSLRAASAFAQQRGAETVSIEAGASSSAPLYASPLGLDELLLGVFLGALDEAQLAERLPPLETLQRLLPVGRPGIEVREPSGSWRFYRMLRSAGA